MNTNTRKKISVWAAAQALTVLAAQQAFAATISCDNAGSCYTTYSGPFDCCATVNSTGNTSAGCCQYKCYHCDLGGGGIQRYGTFHANLSCGSNGLCF